MLVLALIFPSLLIFSLEWVECCNANGSGLLLGVNAWSGIFNPCCDTLSEGCSWPPPIWWGNGGNGFWGWALILGGGGNAIGSKVVFGGYCLYGSK